MNDAVILNDIILSTNFILMKIYKLNSLPIDHIDRIIKMRDVQKSFE